MAARIWGLVILFLCLPAVTGQGTDIVDKFHKTQLQFGHKWNICFTILQQNEDQNISPHGPGYWDEFLTCWQGSGIDQDFRRMEAQIRMIGKEITR